MRGFRAWHRKLNRYLEPHEFYITPIGEVATAYFTTLDGEVIGMNSIEDFSCDDFEEGLVVLEEDTGLKDKNGKEIYEGDIIRYGSKWTLVVTYTTTWCAFELQNPYREGFADLRHERMKTYEVIGNVHENADLLEEK